MLLEKTKALLQRRKCSLEQIAKESGIGYSWLTKFSSGEIPDPGIKRVEDLYRYLVASKPRKSQKLGK